MIDFEKLGLFYLGKKFDIGKKSLLEEPMMYDARDLVTHGVCVGMTGSGKTGLCLSLLEEAAIDNIPALVIDPKGDMTNLLLTFPELQSQDFLPWINQDDAARAELTPEKFAENQAELWRNGLGKWGEDGARIQRLKNAADFTIFTPGSNSGIPVSILKSFASPTAAILEDHESLADLISTTTTGLLGLVGIEADPIKSREHVLIANIFQNAWTAGKDLDLVSLINAIQRPPFERVGAFALDAFYPAKDRFELALALNNLLAAPGFATWLEGETLDASRLLYTPQGKPRISIFYIAHLSDAERMFFVTLLFNQIVSWMRIQPGTTSLRAIVYMDEVMGYLPPVANPPSKAPLMLMLKQGRAFGLGVLLATQNPVDLDYKALSNAGTWFIGRLQTEQDINRIVEGLRSSAAGVDDGFVRHISSLEKRVFLQKNVHEDRPEIFQSRWALSYLRGPLTLAQIKQLTPPAKRAEDAGAPATEMQPRAPVIQVHESRAVRPALPPQVEDYFLPVRGAKPQNAKLVYRPCLLGLGSVRFSNPAQGIDQMERTGRLTSMPAEAIALDWDQSQAASVQEEDLERQPSENADFESLPAAASEPKNYKKWTGDFGDFLYRTSKIDIWKSPTLKQVSMPSESERDFRIRLSQLAREDRDDKVEALRKNYATKLASLQDQIARAEQRVERERGQLQAQSVQTAISFGATVLGAILGRKTFSTRTMDRAGTTMRGGMRTAREKGDVAHAQQSAELLKQRLADLEAEFNSEVTAIETETDPMQQKLEQLTMRPKKADISVRLTALVWAPYWSLPDGTAKPSF